MKNATTPMTLIWRRETLKRCDDAANSQQTKGAIIPSLEKLRTPMVNMKAADARTGKLMVRVPPLRRQVLRTPSMTASGANLLIWLRALETVPLPEGT